jgi:ribosomal protein S18 acetylase RimI-like enzyme
VLADRANPAKSRRFIRSTRKPMARGFSQPSLAVFEEIASAVRLYERMGFTVAARAPVALHALIRFSGDLLVMMRPV